MIHRFGWTCCVLGLALAACDSSAEPASGSGGSAGMGGAGGTGGSPKLVVTADWLNQSLTLLDYGRLVDGASDGPSSVLGTIDLADWEPGPIEVEITPDGKTAVVSVGPGYFDGLPGLVGDPEIPEGGALLVVDLESGVADEVQTKDVPFGIAISPDGTIAYTANYGTGAARGSSLSVIDIPGRRVIEEVDVGSGPEQVALSPDGSLGIVNIVSGRGIRIFQTSDVAGTMSEVLETGSDPSDVSFLDGNDRAAVVNTLGFDVTLIDTSDPSSPSVISSVPVGGGVPYGLTYVPSRDELLAPTNPARPGIATNLLTIARTGDTLTPSAPLQLSGENFPLTAAADSAGDFAFVAHIVDQKLSTIELESGALRAVTWLAGPGPSYVAVQP
jgi:YVTN family beta-propeller protein